MTAPRTPLQCRFLTTQDCAEVLGVSVKTVIQLLRTGDLRGKKYGNTWRILNDELDAYISREFRGGAA